jgi:hypothetical protein
LTAADSLCAMGDKLADDLHLTGELAPPAGTLVESLAPLLTTMKYFGMYFESYDCTVVAARKTYLQLAVNQTHKRRRQSGNWLAKYSAAMLVMHWLNVIRLASAFTSDDQFNPQLINKLISFTITIECCLMQTACYCASRSGQLDRLILGLKVTRDLAEKVRRLSYACVVYNVVSCFGIIGFSVYAIYQNSSVFGFLSAPFFTYIPVNDTWHDVMLILPSIMLVFVTPVWCWSISATLMIVLLLYKSFQRINQQFRAASQRGRFTGHLKTFRVCHQTVRKAVRTADSFLMIGNVSCFCSHIFVIVFLLYAFVCIGYDDQVTAAVNILFLDAAIIGLMMCTANGVLINSSVSFINFLWN